MKEIRTFERVFGLTDGPKDIQKVIRTYSWAFGHHKGIRTLKKIYTFQRKCIKTYVNPRQLMPSASISPSREG